MKIQWKMQTEKTNPKTQQINSNGAERGTEFIKQMRQKRSQNCLNTGATNDVPETPEDAKNWPSQGYGGGMGA